MFQVASKKVCLLLLCAMSGSYFEEVFNNTMQRGGGERGIKNAFDKKRRGTYYFECTNNLRLKTHEHINFTTKKKLKGFDVM